MNVEAATTFVLIPVEEWQLIKSNQQEIIAWIKEQKITSSTKAPVSTNYITAIEFMEAVSASGDPSSMN